MSVADLALQAQNQTESGDFVGACDSYAKLIELEPTMAEVHLNHGCVSVQVGRLDDALASFQKAIALDETLSQAHLNKANLLLRKKDVQGSYDAHSAACTHSPTMVAAWFGKAHTANQLSRHEIAVSSADKALSLDPNHHLSHAERAFALLKLRRAGEALSDVDAVVSRTPIGQLDPRSKHLYSLVLSQVAIEFTRAGDHEGALAYHVRACEGEPTYQNLFNHSVCRIQLKQNKEATELLQQAVAVEPNNWKAHAALGALHMQAEDWANAVDVLMKALSCFDGEVPDESINFNLGVALMNLSREPEAKAPLLRVLQTNPRNWTAAALLGSVYMAEQDYARAREVLTTASENAPTADSSVEYNLGYCDLMLDQPIEAIAHFQEALKLDPESTQARAAVMTLDPTSESAMALSAAAGHVEGVTMGDGNTAYSVAGGANESNAPLPTGGGEMLSALDKALNDPVERAKVLLRPQRPHYLRRPSMEHISLGRVVRLTEEYEELTVEADKKKFSK